jgi:hypothetical protein
MKSTFEIYRQRPYRSMGPLEAIAYHRAIQVTETDSKEAFQQLHAALMQLYNPTDWRFYFEELDMAKPFPERYARGQNRPTRSLQVKIGEYVRDDLKFRHISA